MYLLDTDIVIWVLREKLVYLDLLQELSNHDSVGISVITIAEIYKNIYPSELTKTDEWLREIAHLPVSSTIAKQGGLYWLEYSKKYQTLHILDCLIAATAREHDCTLVTLNKKHFPMDDIEVYKMKK